jgi:tRNA-dependent cyclodipeptide synthase
MASSTHNGLRSRPERQAAVAQLVEHRYRKPRVTGSNPVGGSSTITSPTMENAYPIIGMSPGNSYFKDDAVRFLLQTVIDRFGKAAVFIPDVPAISTYKALGYDEAKAKSTAIAQGNKLRNRTMSAMQELGIDQSAIHIVDWEKDVTSQHEYKRQYDAIVKMYGSNPSFKEVARSATKIVLENSKNDVQDMEFAIDIGVDYLLSEFAFLEFAPTLFNVNKITTVYHKRWRILEEYKSGHFDDIHRPYLEALVITPSKTALRHDSPI